MLSQILNNTFNSYSMFTLRTEDTPDYGDRKDKEWDTNIEKTTFLLV